MRQVPSTCKRAQPPPARASQLSVAALAHSVLQLTQLLQLRRKFIKMNLHSISTQLLSDVEKLRSLHRDYKYLPSSLKSIRIELEALCRLLQDL